MRVLLILPPMVQVNSPYPATPYLTGFLRRHGVDVRQADFAIELVTRLFCRKGLERALAHLPDGPEKAATDTVRHFLEHAHVYLDSIDAVMAFLRGRDPSLALRIVPQ